ncbi:MAG: hypothetical protein QM660_10810 [Dysgonomonas sp.]
MKKVTKEDEKELLSIENNYYDIVEIPRSKDKWKVRWLNDVQLEKISILELKSGLVATEQDSISNIKSRAKFLSKAAAYCLLSGLNIHFLYVFLWRYLYYVKAYTADQLLPIIQTAKKKAPQVESYLAMVLVGQMKITNPMLTTEEQSRFQAELSSALNQPSEKNTDGL